MFKLPIQYYRGGEDGGRSTPPPSKDDEGGVDTQVVKLGERVATVDTTIKCLLCLLLK